MNEFKYIQDIIGVWGDKTFPDSSPETILSHLQEEIKELVDAQGDYQKNDCDRSLEAADCFLLLLHYAHKLDFDMLDVAIRKMKVNINRTWKAEPEPGGHYKHEES
ncbi:hypothetical protein LCGC14_2934640 [marine sediment metagenome]|uniref:dATP/dGTP diphosphohydrolase MazZ domain-containing protein n=1 Tax=marine sediment metagenome TaxID=412755 RepID=A0A0F8XJV8_9ZZZZ